MKFEEYLRIVVPKIGPNAAFDLFRDARMKALENLLIDKEVATKEELEAEVERELGESAQNIVSIPPFPKEPKKENDTKKSNPD